MENNKITKVLAQKHNVDIRNIKEGSLESLILEIDNLKTRTSTLEVEYNNLLLSHQILSAKLENYESHTHNYSDETIDSAGTTTAITKTTTGVN